MIRKTSERVLRTVALMIVSSATLASAQFIAPAPLSAPGLNVRQPLTTDPAILFPADREMRIMPGDLLSITIFGTLPDYKDVERVSLDGSIRLNLAGIVPVQGLSLKEAEASLSKRFEDLGMFHSAQVSIDVTEAPAHIATVLGETHGTVPIAGAKRLFDVLATVGGLGPSVSSIVTIDRPGLPTPIVLDLGSDPAHSTAANVSIFAGDTITLGRVGGYYVVGAVKNAGAQQLNGVLPTTALQAIASAGGALFEARMDDARLVRTIGNQRTVVNVRLKQIMAGKEPDPVLQTDDILLIPTNQIKALLRAGGVTTAVAIAIAATQISRP